MPLDLVNLGPNPSCIFFNRRQGMLVLLHYIGFPRTFLKMPFYYVPRDELMDVHPSHQEVRPFLPDINRKSRLGVSQFGLITGQIMESLSQGIRCSIH